MKNKCFLFSLLLWYGSGIVHAQPQVVNGTSYLMNQAIDLSSDFGDLSNTLFLADALQSFDVNTGEGRVQWKRAHLQPRQAFGEFYQFNLSSCIRQQNSLTAQFVSFSLSNLANIFYPPIFTIINLCLL